MRRLRGHINENFQDGNLKADARYELAYKRVKKIKGFYVHLIIYILVNAFVFVNGLIKNELKYETFTGWEIYSTPFFWGIGLLAHGLTVFGRNIFFSDDWEERKIKEFMDKDKSQKWELVKGFKSLIV